MSTSANLFKRLLTGVLLLSFAASIVLARLHTYDEPLERDLTTYAVIAHEMLDGRALYTDLWDHKPPAVHVSYMAAELVAGYGEAAIFLLGLTTAFITLFGVYTAGRLYDGRRSTGVWAALFWTLTCSDMGLQANQPNVEVFLNASLIWAFVFFLKIIEHPAQRRNVLGAGLMLALASAYKMVAVFIALPLALVLIADGCRDDRRYLSVMVRHCLTLALIGATTWLLIAGYFWIAGGFHAFYDTVITFNRSYSGGIGKNLAAGLGVERLLPEFLRFAWPLIALLAGGLLAGLLRGRAVLWSLLVAYAVGVAVGIAAPGFFHPHYYQLWLPVLSIGAAWTVSLLGDAMLVRYRVAGHVAGALAGGAILMHVLPQYQLDADAWSRAKYGEQFVVTKTIGLKIPEVITADETFYEWGAETGLYFYSRKSPPTGVFYHYPLFPGRPSVPELSARIIAQLEQHPPALVILFRPHLPQSEDPQQLLVGGHPVLDWIGARYRLVPNLQQEGVFAFLTEENSRLYNAFAARR